MLYMNKKSEKKKSSNILVLESLCFSFPFCHGGMKVEATLGFMCGFQRGRQTWMAQAAFVSILGNGKSFLKVFSTFCLHFIDQICITRPCLCNGAGKNEYATFQSRNWKWQERVVGLYLVSQQTVSSQKYCSIRKEKLLTIFEKVFPLLSNWGF